MAWRSDSNTCTSTSDFDGSTGAKSAKQYEEEHQKDERKEEQKVKRGDKYTVVLEHKRGELWAGFDHLYKRLESRFFDRIVCDKINNSSRTGCTSERREREEIEQKNYRG